MKQKTLDTWGKPEGPHVLRVFEVVKLITGLLSDEALSGIWVTGEITNYKKHSSGHLFFSLSETGDENESAISCTIWKPAVRFLPLPLRDGMQVQAYGSIQHYERGGRYSFNITQVRPAGAGEKVIQIDQWRRELGEKGFFAPEKKRPLPPYPEKIGVVTSQTGAVFHDIRNVAAGRFPVEIILSPTAVQGPFAHEEIAAAIRRVEKMTDLIIVGRGGGSYEDLFAFNHPVVVEAIARCPVPIIAAIGHEVDITLADLAADHRASTPSHAAELCVPDKKAELESITHMQRRMQGQLTTRLIRSLEELDDLRDRVSSGRIRRYLSERHQYIADLSDRLYTSTNHNLERQRHHLERLTLAIRAKNPAEILIREIPERRLLLSSLTERMDHAVNASIERRKMEIQTIYAQIQSCGPNALWKRGFCLVSSGGRTITSVSNLEIDDMITLRFKDGIADAKIRNMIQYEEI